MHPDAEQDDDRRELFLDREVRDLVDDLVRLLQAAGRDEDRRQLRELQAEARDLGDEPATVVVVGETGRGKSSMINALLSRPGLLPVDFDTATSTTIIVQHGERERAEMLSGGGTDVTEVELGELARWATVAGERQRVADAEDADHADRARDLAAPVHSLLVSTPSRLLADGLVLIDTPGVGGLDGDHARITLQALKDADALLFVLAPDAGISRPELDFLKQATNRIGVVLFVVAKIDQTRAWREIQDEDRYLIGAEVPLFAHAPVLGISSNRKVEADRHSARGGEETAADFLAASGFAELEAEIRRRVIGRAAHLRCRNLVRACQVLVQRLEETAALRCQDVAAPEPELIDQLRAETEFLADFEQRAATVKAELESALSGLAAEVDQEAHRRADQLQRQFRRRTQQQTGRSLRGLDGELNVALQAIVVELNEQCDLGVLKAAERTLRSLPTLGLGALVFSYEGLAGVRLSDEVEPILDLNQAAAKNLMRRVRGASAALAGPDAQTRGSEAARSDAGTAIEARPLAVGDAGRALVSLGAMSGRVRQVMTSERGLQLVKTAGPAVLVILAGAVIAAFLWERQQVVEEVTTDRISRACAIITDQLLPAYAERIGMLGTALWKDLRDQAASLADETGARLRQAEELRDAHEQVRQTVLRDAQRELTQVESFRVRTDRLSARLGG